MALPTYDEMLRERFDARKREAQTLVDAVVGEAASQYAALEMLVPELFALAEHFKEPLSFTVNAEQVALKQRVMTALGPIVAASVK